MRVYKNKYRYHWISPYTICERICFWREIDYNESWVKVVNRALEPVCTVLMKFLDIVHPKIDYVKIEPWDTWSMDSTLTPIILPMLKQLKETKHGSPNVEDKEVPKELRSTSAPPKENEYDIDENHFKRWDWVLDEMIWAFEQLADDDWEKQYFSGQTDYKWIDNPDGGATLETGPNHTYTCDKKGWAKHNKRIQNGLELFGKYYRNLWD